MVLQSGGGGMRGGVGRWEAIYASFTNFQQFKVGSPQNKPWVFGRVLFSESELGLFIVGREEGGVDVHLNLQQLSLNCWAGFLSVLKGNNNSLQLFLRGELNLPTH